MCVSRGGILLLVLIAVSAVGCGRVSSPREAAVVVADSPGTTVTAPFQIPVIELRGSERPGARVRLRKGRFTLPQGDVTAAVGGMGGSPLGVPQEGELRAVIGAIESASMTPGDNLTPLSQLDAILYLDIEIGDGEHSIIDVRFGAGDAVLVGNHIHDGGLDMDAMVSYQTQSPRLARLLRDAVGYRQVDRSVLQGAESATLLEHGSAVRHALTKEEAAEVKAAVLRARPLSPSPRLHYDCVFEFALPSGENEVVTYDIGAGRFGLGPDGCQVDTADRLALKSLIGTRVDTMRVLTYYDTFLQYYRP